MEIVIRKYEEKDLCAMTEIWNEIVEEGNAFPQEEFLTSESGTVFFAEQTYTGVAVDAETEKIYGLYILHPNNIGRCGHICNASYAVSSHSRGLHIGENWCWIVLSKDVNTDFPFCSLMRLLQQICMPDIYMSVSALLN